MHHLMSLKLVSSSFNVIPISPDGSRRIKTNTFDGSVTTNHSLLDVYANREKYAETIPNIVMLNFIDFASKYKLVNKKLITQPQNTIPRVSQFFLPIQKAQILAFIVNISCSDTNPSRPHRKMLGTINQALTKYTLLHGKHSFKQNMLNGMYLIGLKNCKLYKICQKMTQIRRTSQNNCLNVKNGCI